MTVAENGGTATFTAVLSIQPGANVILTATSSDTGEAIVSPATLVFTPLNWNQPRTITVTGVSDYRTTTDSARIFVAVDPASGSLWTTAASKNVLVTCTNDDVAGIIIGTPSGSTSEAGGTATFTVSLKAQPTSNVTLPLSCSDISEGTVDPAAITFTPDTWNVPQTVTVTGVDDSIVDGSIIYKVITGTTVSPDIKFNGQNPADVSITNLDDEVPGFLLSQTELEVAENGGTATFTAVLARQPAGSVVLSVSSSSTAEATVSVTSISFSTTNWNIPRTITVKGTNDYKPGNDSATIRVAVNTASSSKLWSLVPAQTVAVTCLNDDIPAFSLSKTALAVAENGGYGTFTAVLTAQPAANVVLTVSSSATGEATVVQAVRTFTAANWKTAQTVTVRGVNDSRTTTDTATISVSVNPDSSDARWIAAPAKTVDVTCINDDAA
jgi:uncharacterized protein YggE